MTEPEHGHKISHVGRDDAVVKLLVRLLVARQRIEPQLLGGKIQGNEELGEYIRSDQAVSRAYRFLAGDIDQSIVKFDASDANALRDAAIAAGRFQVVAETPKSGVRKPCDSRSIAGSMRDQNPRCSGIQLERQGSPVDIYFQAVNAHMGRFAKQRGKRNFGLLIRTDKRQDAAAIQRLVELYMLAQVRGVFFIPAGVCQREIFLKRLDVLRSMQPECPVEKNSRIFRVELVSAAVILSRCLVKGGAFGHARQAPPGQCQICIQFQRRFELALGLREIAPPEQDFASKFVGRC